MAGPHHHPGSHHHPSRSLAPLLPGLSLLQSQWTKSERSDTSVMSNVQDQSERRGCPQEEVTRRSPVMAPFAERAQTFTCGMSHSMHKDATALQCPLLLSPAPVSQPYPKVPWAPLKRRGGVWGAEGRGWGGCVGGRGLGEVME